MKGPAGRVELDEGARGAHGTDSEEDETMTKSVKPTPDGYHTVTPYLVVDDPDGMLDYLERAFGAETLSRHVDGDGRVAHAEARIGDSRVMLGQANEQWPPTTAMLHLYVEDVDAAFQRAIEAGGTVVREPIDEFYGDRSGGLRDRWGNQWWMATHVEDVSEDEMQRRMAARGG
jgi:uncharacterized glyoxalase superfamily protein PhnB